MRSARRMLCLPLVGVLAATGVAQFDVHDWTITAPGPGATSFEFTETTLTVTGPVYPDPCLDPINAYASTVIPFDATVSFRLHFIPDDGLTELDWPLAIVNGDVTHLNHCQGCEVVIDVPAGGSFGLGNHTEDCLFSASVSIFSELKIVPKAGSLESLGVSAFENYGHRVASLGDLDADGIDDYAVGAPRANLAGFASGRVTVLSGADGSPLFTLTGTAAGQFFGFSLAAAGDVNGDGVPDVLVGAPFAGGTGNVRLFSGAGGALLGTWSGDQAGDEFGSAVASVGDADGDDVPDFAAGAHQGDLGGPTTGYVRVYSGETGLALTTVVGSQLGQGYGAAIAGAGDLDGDGVPEMVLGVPGHDEAGVFDTGAVEVRSALTGTLLWSAAGATEGARLGSSVDSVGDVDGDLVADIAAGAPKDDGAQNMVGRAYVYSGATGAPLFSAAGGLPGDQLGAAVAAAGDVDDDGRPDVLVGAPGATWLHTPGHGTACVLSGRDGTLIGVVAGSQSDARLGWSVASAGDLDGDGRSEVLVGAPGFDFAGFDSGQVQVVSLEVLWADFGHGLAGSLGVPTLAGSGLLVGGETVKLKLQDVPAFKQAPLVVGFDTLLAPFKGGVMVPDPSAILALHTGPSGITLSANWPGAIPSGVDVYFQFWIVDPAGPAGFSASNAVRATTP